MDVRAPEANSDEDALVGLQQHEKLRVLHRINLNVAGGVENQFQALIEHSAVRAQVRSQVLIGEPVHMDLSRSVYGNTDGVCSFKHWRQLKVPRKPARLREANVTRLVRQATPDVVLSWSAFARTDLSRACQRTRVPLVHREGGGAWFRRPPAAAAEYVSQMRGAVCNTRASQRILQLKWGYDGPARVCLGGLRPDLLQKADRATDRAVRHRWRLGTAGRLAAEKGVCLAIHALRQLRQDGVDCELAIAGSGPDQRRLERLVEELGLGEDVEFLGRVNDMASFYDNVDVLLHPAVREPLGNVTIEAGAFGVPVVATRVDGMAETIQHGITGFTVAATEPVAMYAEYGGSGASTLPDCVYDPDSDGLREVRFAHPHALADAVAEILSDQARYEAMAAAVARFVRERFGFDRYIAEVLDALQYFAGHAE